MTAGTLLIRADANASIGTGHVMRCLGLAQAWQDAGGRAVFAMVHCPSIIGERLRAEMAGVSTLGHVAGSADDAHSCIQAARECGARWVVVDGYQFGAPYQQSLSDAGLKVLAVDDTAHAEYYPCDLLLNQNAQASAEMYRSRGRSTRLLLGPRYALLRREFLSRRNFRRQIPESARKVLIAMGGSDPTNVTSKVIEALRLTRTTELEVVVVAGGSNPHLESLRALVAESGRAIRLLENVSNMADWMIWADVAVSAAGTTCWELCFLGLPSVLLDIAPNQTPVARELDRLGAAVHVRNATNAKPETIASSLNELILSKDNRAAISCKAGQLVDGRGAARVVAAIRSYGLSVRTAGQEDCHLLWEWANDPVVRSASFSQAPIPWENHLAWFAGKMNSPNCIIFIGEDEHGHAIGQFRMDRRSADTGEVAVSLASDARGLGYGTQLIELGVREVFAQTDTQRVIAYIRPENRASIMAFEGAGFRRQVLTQVKGCAAIEYLRFRDPQT